MWLLLSLLISLGEGRGLVRVVRVLFKRVRVDKSCMFRGMLCERSWDVDVDDVI